MVKKTLFEKVEAEVINETKDYFKSKVQKKIIRIGELSILILISFILISIGVSAIIGNMFPILAGGYSYLLIGILLLLISYLLKI